MKIKRLVVIATLVVFAMVSTANAGGVQGSNKPAGKDIDITLKEAMSNLALIAALNQQVSLAQVLNSSSTIYTATVVFQNNIVEVTGQVSQWIAFFKSQSRPGSLFTIHQIKVK